MKKRTLIKTRTYSQSELKNLTPFMLQYDKLHEVITNTTTLVVATIDVESNYVRPSGKRTVDSKGNVYYVCGHKKTAE